MTFIEALTGEQIKQQNLLRESHADEIPEKAVETTNAGTPRPNVTSEQVRTNFDTAREVFDHEGIYSLNDAIPGLDPKVLVTRRFLMGMAQIAQRGLAAEMSESERDFVSHLAGQVVHTNNRELAALAKTNRIRQRFQDRQSPQS